jgi:hypothetical protein
MGGWSVPVDPPPPRWKCPICGKKLLDARGVTQHMADKHVKPQHQERILEWLAHPTRL